MKEVGDFHRDVPAATIDNFIPVVVEEIVWTSFCEMSQVRIPILPDLLCTLLQTARKSV